MTENTNTANNQTPKWLIALLLGLILVVGIQSVWLFNLANESQAQASGSEVTETRAGEPLPITNHKVGPVVWDPFAEMQRMREEMDRLFGQALNRFGESDQFAEFFDPGLISRPRIDVQEDGKSYIVTVDLPGVEGGKIETSLDERTLTVTAETEVVSEERDDESSSDTFVRRERHFGRFQRSIVFDKPVRSEGMRQSYEDGVLEIQLPKVDVEE
jgi:HSP20 family protein